MHIKNNIALKPFNTFGISAKAKRYANIKDIDRLKQVLLNSVSEEKFILGGGSNMLLTKDIDALVLHINLTGISVINETEDHVFIEAKAGENWHNFVLHCIAHNYGGIENLSLIPGNIGTAPIQNIGAYGVELKDVFYSCNAVKISDASEKTFYNDDCKFGYRESIFKQELKDQYIITSVCLKLTKRNHKLNINYGAIKAELEHLKINNPTIKDVSKAVINIRQSKLPDPKKIGNSGSFFKNPVISVTDFNSLKTNFADVPHYVVSDSEIKIPAGWLIETAGFKGKRFGDYGVHSKQALVLVNYDEAKGADILKLAKLIQQTVLRLFNIKIETEVNIF